MAKQSVNYNHTVHTVWVTSTDIGMVLEMDKSSTVGIKKGKNMEYTEMPDEQRMKNIEESGYRYLCIIQDTLHKK